MSIVLQTLPFCNKFCDIFHTHGSFLLPRLDTVSHHGHAERAGYGDCVSPRFQRFIGAFHVNVLFPPLGFLKHLRSASATAQPSRFASLHFYQVGIERREHIPRRFVHLIRPAKVARIVIRNASSLKGSAFLQDDTSLPDQSLKERRMMFYRVVSTQLRILIFDCIETMRACRDDRADVVSVENLNIVERLHLEQELIPCTARRIPRAAFLGTQHSKIDIQHLQYLHKRARHPLAAVVERSCAANPEQYFWRLSLRGEFCHGRYLLILLFHRFLSLMCSTAFIRPVETVGRPKLPGGKIVFDVLKDGVPGWRRA